MIRKRKLANRQQSIAMAARMKNIRTAVAFDIPDELDRLVKFSLALILPALFAQSNSKPGGDENAKILTKETINCTDYE